MWFRSAGWLWQVEADVPHFVFGGVASTISTVLIPHLSRLREHATIEITEAEDTEALRDLGLGAVDVVLIQPPVIVLRWWPFPHCSTTSVRPGAARR